MEKDVFILAIKFITKVFFIMLAVNLVVGGLFGYYIYKSFEETSVNITSTQDGYDNKQEVTNG